MKALLQNKLLLLTATVALIAMFGYRSFVGTMPVSNGESALVVGQDLLTLSNQLSEASLSQDIFSTPGYRFLTDFSVPVPNQTFGRNNPFDEFGQ
jgi:hypothetical protein